MSPEYVEAIYTYTSKTESELDWKKRNSQSP